MMKFSLLEIFRKIKSTFLHSDEKYVQKEHNTVKRRRDLDQKSIQVDAQKNNKDHALLAEPKNELSNNGLDSMVSMASDNEKQQDISQDAKTARDDQNKPDENDNILSLPPYERAEDKNITNELENLDNELQERPNAELTGTVSLETMNVQDIYPEGDKSKPELSKNDEVANYPQNELLENIGDNLKSKAPMHDEKVIQEIEVLSEKIEQDIQKKIIEEDEADSLCGEIINASGEEHLSADIVEDNETEIEETGELNDGCSEKQQSDNSVLEIANCTDDENEIIENIKEKSVRETASKDRNVSPYSRSELEQMYQDEIQLIVKPLNPVNLKLLHPVEDTNEYTHLRNRIMQEFLDVKLLCEIEINDREYRVLCEYFRKKYVYIRRDVGHAITDVLFCVALVQIGIRNYDGNFWKHISKVLFGKEDKNIPINQRNWIGGTFTETMIGFGKPIYKENEYVTNIMMHCFVVDTFAARFFEYLFQYYDLDMERDISSGVEDESVYICNSIKNPYGKRKQFLSNYQYLTVRGNPEYCQNAVSNLLKLIDQNFWDEYIENISGGRLFDIFKKWQTETGYFQNEKRKLHSMLSGKKRIKNFRSPHLVCDMENERFSIILPAQVVPTNMENSELKWKISNEQDLFVPCEVQEGYLGKKTKEINLPIENNDIFASFRFTLLADEQEIRTFAWKEQIVNFFNEDGDWIKGENLSEGMVYAYTEVDRYIAAEGLLSESVRRGLKFYEFNLVVGDLINVDETEHYYIGEIHKAGLLNEYKVEDMYLNYNGEKISVYSKLPALIVDVEDEKFNGTGVWINGEITRLSEKSFVNINMGRRTEQKLYYISMESMQGIRTGINQILVDFPASTRKIQCEFGYIPEFDFMFEDAPYVYMNRGTLSLNRKIVNDKIAADVIDETQKYDFSFETLDENHLVIPLEFREGVIDAVFEVPVFIYSWDKEKWYAQKNADIWHSELRDMLFIKYPATRITLSIRGASSDKPAIVFNKNREGIFECDLTKLKTYFDKNKMLQIVTMIYQGVEQDIIRIIMKSFLQSAMLEADYEKECVRGTFDVIGKGQYYVDIFCGDDLLIEKKLIDSTMMEMQIPIQSAKYLVKVYEIEGDEFSFDEDYLLIGENTVELVDPADLVKTCIGLNYFFAIDDPARHLELNYEYMVFIEQKINPHRYWGLLVETFHHNNVINASMVMIDIPNLNVTTCVSLLFIDKEDGEEYEFLYDNYAKRIVENENPKYSKSEAYRRYEHVLYNDSYLCNVNFTERRKEMEDKGYELIKNHESAREKNGIWKDDFALSKMSIDQLGLSVRSYNCLKRAGVDTITKIQASIQDGSIDKIRNLGRKNIDEIKYKIKQQEQNYSS